MTQPQNTESFGIKMADAGYSVTNAPDYALLFNSSWATLQIAATFSQVISPTYDGTGWSYPVTTFTHNLGLWALADCWHTQTPSGGSAIATTRSNGAIHLGQNSIIWTPGIYTTVMPPTLTVYINVYPIDISKQTSYNYIQPPAQSMPYDPNYGLKIVKPNRSIISRDLRDFIIHTRAQSPAILAIINESSADTSGNLTYQNQQNYTNWVTGYTRSWKNGSNWYYQMAPSQSQSFPAYKFINGNTYQLNIGTSSNYGGGTPTGSLVVFRDPLFTGKQVSVTY